MKKVIIAVGIITLAVVLYIGAYYGSKAFSTPKDSQLVDRIIALQEEQQAIFEAAQKDLLEKAGPIDKEMVSLLKRLNITDRQAYLRVMKAYFPKVEAKNYLPDPNAKEAPAIITPAPTDVAPAEPAGK